MANVSVNSDYHYVVGFEFIFFKFKGIPFVIFYTIFQFIYFYSTERDIVTVCFARRLVCYTRCVNLKYFSEIP